MDKAVPALEVPRVLEKGGAADSLRAGREEREHELAQAAGEQQAGRTPLSVTPAGDSAVDPSRERPHGDRTGSGPEPGILHATGHDVVGSMAEEVKDEEAAEAGPAERAQAEAEVRILLEHPGQVGPSRLRPTCMDRYQA